MSVIELGGNKLAEIVEKADKKIVVDCYTTWCGPCKMFASVFHEVASENPSIDFYKINMEEAEELAEQYDISTVPTVLVFEDGKLKSQVIWPKTKDELMRVIHE